jgi:aspartyl-tRNA(Asn)/glutamyl-tRNA(Gln) amidotransferase subunit B
MEKGHLRCDANISITDGNKMSEIIEIKNLNSFRFVEKALMIEEEKLKSRYPDWPERLTKRTHGYNSDKNITYIQREKEEAADYRYFPEPDLPPIDASQFDLEALKAEFNETEEEKIVQLVGLGVGEADAKVLAKDKIKSKIFGEISVNLEKVEAPFVAKAIVQNYFGFNFDKDDFDKAPDYAKAILGMKVQGIQKVMFSEIAKLIHTKGLDFEKAFEQSKESEIKQGDIDSLVENVLQENTNEVDRYKKGEKQLLGFLMGQAMKKIGKSANPQEVNRMLKEKLEG